MPDKHEELACLVAELQETVNELKDQVTELDNRTITLKDFSLTNELHRIDQILIGVQERLDALEKRS